MVNLTFKSLPDADPLVKDYIEDLDWHFVSPALLERSALILQSLIDEARARGLEAARPKPKHGTNSNTFGAHARTPFWIVSAVESYRIRLVEITKPGGKKRQPTYGHPTWLHERPWEFIPSGRLELRVTGFGINWDGAKVRDAKSIQLETRLPEIFDLIAQCDEKSRESTARNAKLQLEYEGRAAIQRVAAGLDKKVKSAAGAWSRAQEIRAFADAVADRAWAERCRAVADIIDPLHPALAVTLDLHPLEKDLNAWLYPSN